MNTLLVVIPVWPGDYELVLSNLKQQFERDGKCQHPALIVYDQRSERHKPSFLSEIQTSAQQAFTSVRSLRYDEHKGDEPWPRQQNHCWQSVARYLEEHPTKAAGWFWWESDVVPLKPGWLDVLANAYVAGKKPFMGHVVPERGHMNGVAVYPFSIAAYATNALLVKNSPFDVMLSKEVGLHSVHAVNHLMAHRLKGHGGDAPAYITQADIEALPETTVTIHGYCKVGPEQLKKIKEQKKEQAMNETSKAMRRRHCEEASGGFQWSKIFRGQGVDVGAGNDPIQLPNCRPFDMLDGDANHLSRYFSKDSLDYVHASQCLEHMIDPRAALLNWSICVKPGGHIVVTVPDFDAYEKRHWPSRFNPDHKSAWSIWRKADKIAPLINVPAFAREMTAHGLGCLRYQFVDTNFDYKLSDDVDQTLSPDAAEAFIELVFEKQV